MADDSLESVIIALDDKDAVKVASALVGQAFSTVGDVPPEELADNVAGALSATGKSIQLGMGDEWLDIDLPPDEAGPIARSLLLAAARNPGLASIINSEITESDQSLDLGSMAALVPVAVMYLLLSTEIRYERGKLTIVKHGYSAKELNQLVKSIPKAAIDKIANILGSEDPPS